MLVHELNSRSLWEASELQDWQSGPLEAFGAIVSDSEQRYDPFRVEPSCDEQERFARRGVQPLSVVDHDEHRASLGRGGQEAQCRRAERKTVGSDRRAQRQRPP